MGGGIRGACHIYALGMTAQSAPTAPGRPAAHVLRAESEAVYAAFAAGALGGIYGFIVGVVAPDIPLSDSSGAFALLAGVGAAVVAAGGSFVGYWRTRGRPGEEWRRSLSSWRFTVDTISVVVAHTALSFLAVSAALRLLADGFVGLPVVPFLAVVMMTVSLGLTAYVVFLSASRMTTRRTSSLLVLFITVGTLTAMLTTPDPEWWKVNFSLLGTFGDASSWTFNGTLIAGGLLVSTFAVYVARDAYVLVSEGELSNTKSPQTVATLLVVMGTMLGCVGIFPVNRFLLLHNLSASGMALMFFGLLIGGPWLLRGMPRTYFVASWAFLAAAVGSAVLFGVGYFNLTAFEVIVFALIFGWIAVFIRFLSVTGQPGDEVRSYGIR